MATKRHVRVKESVKTIMDLLDEVSLLSNFYKCGTFEDAMPVSFRSILFTSNILTIFKQRNLLPYIWEHACKNNTEKWLDYNQYSQLTRWCSGNASALGARRLGFNPQLRQGFYVWFFVLLLLCFYFLSKTHYLSHKFTIPFTILNYLVY